MEKNLTWRIVLIIVLLVVAAYFLYPPNKTLKPGIDLGGGTSLIYEIDAQGLSAEEKRGLSSRMITILRRRIDPANIQNIIWRPQGNTRFEIQMPLANAEARTKRQNYEKALSELLNKNINSAVIMRSLPKPEQQRNEDFQKFAQQAPERLEILNGLANAFDERLALQKERDELYSKLKTPESLIELAGLELDQIKLQLGDWIKLDEQKLEESLKEFLGDSEGNLDLLTRYTKMYAQWAEVVGQLTIPETGKNDQYKKAKRTLDKLNLTKDQIDFVLAMPARSTKRIEAIEQLEAEFADRTDLIGNTAAAFEEYRPFQGRLDDPQDLQRMLKGAGILEFRILPTLGHPKVDSDRITSYYVELLRTKGPKYASDNKYVWCEIENIDQWNAADGQKRPAVVAAFANKYYVLASNQKSEAMLHGADRKQWKLKKAAPGQDQMGRRAISFLLDERAGRIFSKITGKNIDRPLCILLDGLAISAPNVQSKISTRGIITGRFTSTEVNDMVNKLNAGSLPARLIEQPISVKSVGPSIGADNRDKGITAGQVGFIIVVLCMAIYYVKAGVIADLALLMNLLFILAVMALVRATFTLPGIAGIILTIGMSVDANVLIFERIREEQQKGSSLRIAIKNGYQRAFRTIWDANLTTFITAAILFWVASEEIKGFAIVLMLGIGSSMFTALFVTRVSFDFLLAKRLIRDHLFMFRIIKKPNVNWMKLRPVFLIISSVLIVAGLTVFFTRDNVKNNKYDIEFTGGTSAQINLKDDSLSRQDVADRIHKIGLDLENPALAAANVYSIGKSNKQYEINTTETNKTTVIVTFPQANQQTVDTITSAIKKVDTRLSNLTVTAGNPADFIITTSNANKSLVKNVLNTAFADVELSEPQVDEVVNNAILKAFADKLEIQQNLQPRFGSPEKITEELIDSYPELADFLGGLKITCDIERAATAGQIERRLADLRFKPDMQDLNWYSYRILDSELNPTDPNQTVETFVYLSVDPEAGYRELTEDEWTQFVENEIAKVRAAVQMETSLPRVTQISPSVGAEAKTQALIAIVLSLFAIVTYIWVRFGNIRYGIAAIVALVHDVCITLGAVTACTYIADTPLGKALLLGDFKISLPIIAAFLTIIGYSLNDTIVIFDRIRENRRKGQLRLQTINDSINQTLSRTLLTSFTTFIVVLIMYIFGGQAMRGFTFAIGFGVIVGTYSSVAIAAPILLIGTKGKTEKNK